MTAMPVLFWESWKLTFPEAPVLAISVTKCRVEFQRRFSSCAGYFGSAQLRIVGYFGFLQSVPVVFAAWLMQLTLSDVYSVASLKPRHMSKSLARNPRICMSTQRKETERVASRCPLQDCSSKPLLTSYHPHETPVALRQALMIPSMTRCLSLRRKHDRGCFGYS